MVGGKLFEKIWSRNRFIEKATFQQRLKEGEGVSCVV